MLISTSSSMLSLRFDSLETLQQAYMPFLKNGGLFVPHTAISKSTRPSAGSYEFKSSVCLLLKLLDDPRQFISIVRIVWITPTQVRNGHSKGFGLQFARSDTELRSAIESKLHACTKNTNYSQTL